MSDPSVPQVQSLNGLSLLRRTGVIFVPLPRAMWRPIEGGCSCPTCQVRGESSMFWDTLAIAAQGDAGDRLDTTWTVHSPELHAAPEST